MSKQITEFGTGTVTKTGQITIPKKIRDVEGFKPGTKLLI
jgi:AbrB family looped-hinge helix DNA binding protein